MRELTGRVAVVTGAGSGIGAALARACAHAGMSVAVVDRDANRAQQTESELDAEGVRAKSYVVDVHDPGAVRALAADVFEHFGGCHLLCNNAGVSPLGRAWVHSDEEWQHVLGVNVLGVVHGVNAFVPLLLEQGGEAHVVNTGSAAALRFVPSLAMYSASKAAVVAFSDNLRHDLASHGIGVSVLCPGSVDTNIGDSTFAVGVTDRDPAEIEEAVGALMAGVDPAHNVLLTPDLVADLTLEAVRENRFHVITHPGSLDAVLARNREVEQAYRDQHERHPELP